MTAIHATQQLRGLPEVREALSQFAERFGQMRYGANEVILTVGEARSLQHFPVHAGPGR